MHVLILHDRIQTPGAIDEEDVLLQAEGVARALRELGHTSKTGEFGLDLASARDLLRREKPDIIFNLVESIEGQGRLIHLAPTLYESLGIPFTGAGAEAMFLTSCKTSSKKILHQTGIPTPPWVTREELSTGKYETAPPRGFDSARPFLFKSDWEHGSIGVNDHSLVFPEPASSKQPGYLRGLMEERRKTIRGGCFAEQFIDGREFNLALLDTGTPGAPPQVLPPGEIIFEDYPDGKPRIVDYRAKWEEDSFEYNHTPRHFEFHQADAPLLRELTRLAIACWELFGLRGYARVDFRVDSSGNPYVLEVNANPCLSPEAGYAAAVEEAGLTYTRAVERILQGTLNT